MDRTIFPAERARGMLHWLEEMHAAGIYRDEVAYPHLKQMAMEFELPLELGAKLDGPEPRAFASWNVAPPATPRPMIKDFQAMATTSPRTKSCSGMSLSLRPRTQPFWRASRSFQA